MGLASRGAQLLHRALSEMYIGEPEPLREIAFNIADARPEVVAIRNVGVSAYRTAREARSGDRMAAAARSVARLARLLGDTPTSLARRGQPLLPEGAVVATHGRSESVACGHRSGRRRNQGTPHYRYCCSERGRAALRQWTSRRPLRAVTLCCWDARRSWRTVQWRLTRGHWHWWRRLRIAILLCRSISSRTR